MQFLKCIGFEQELQKCDGSKNFSAFKLKWSLQSGTLGIKSELGRGGGMSLILKHNQGILHGWPDNVQCGVQWPCLQILHLPLCLGSVWPEISGSKFENLADSAAGLGTPGIMLFSTISLNCLFLLKFLLVLFSLIFTMMIV
jgi:hypothetical protein